jgi:cell division protein ZapA (FtsZ GTPase activity inhibitor)
LAKRSVAVRIAGQEYRIKSDADEAWLQRVARYVDEAMGRIRERTGTVDSRDIAVLTSLNLARELITLRDARDHGQTRSKDDEARLRVLIEFVESAAGIEAGAREPDRDEPDRREGAELPS